MTSLSETQPEKTSTMLMGAVFGILIVIALVVYAKLSEQKVANTASDPVTQENVTTGDFIEASSGDVAAGDQVTKTGKLICLPKVDTEGPQTMECAFGLETAEGNYGLRDMDPNSMKIAEVPMGIRVRVTGALTEQPDTLYDSLGVIEVAELEELEKAE